MGERKLLLCFRKQRISSNWQISFICAVPSVGGISRGWLSVVPNEGGRTLGWRSARAIPGFSPAAPNPLTAWCDVGCAEDMTLWSRCLHPGLALCKYWRGCALKWNSRVFCEVSNSLIASQSVISLPVHVESSNNNVESPSYVESPKNLCRVTHQCMSSHPRIYVESLTNIRRVTQARSLFIFYHLMSLFKSIDQWVKVCIPDVFDILTYPPPCIL